LTTQVTEPTTKELSIKDTRTGAIYDLAIKDGTISSGDLKAVKTGPGDYGLMAYDPGFTNTAACRSAITFIDGNAGVLEYRGYPIEQLADKSAFAPVTYLLVSGNLPDPSELDAWNRRLADECTVPPEVFAALAAMSPSAHPMGLLGGLTA
jgi:citrate synthase